LLDKDIRREDVQALSSADQIAAFFAALGYQADARLTQTAANIGVTTESLARQIKRLERIADQEGLLQVYLFELSSVTVAATRGLAGALRNRAGNYLLVLTHDYERIDFVLVEKIAPSPETGLLAHKIPDRHLALGLDLLARDDDEKTLKRVFIDYKSLDVRQLGSIYEGLLEFRLRIAPEKMAICKGKKTEEVVPYGEAKQRKLKILTAGRGKDAAERTLSKGAVHLENDKRERKATGSYYTPDYIVKYIVEQTVGPVLAERFEQVRPLLREAQKSLRAKQDKARALERKFGKADDPEREAFLKHRDVVDALFGIKVLDPAMGSGHFLVEAVDFITDRMLDFLNGFPWNPVLYQLQETRETILRDLDEQKVTVDAGKLTDVHLLKRHVLKRCLYGVDINPMAVELAKLSLWLRSFTLGAPLSFLDHHLKCGNSLIGVTVEEVNREIQTGQMSLLSGTRFEGMKQAVAGMIHIGELSDVTPAQVRESRLEFKRASEAMAPAKRLLDAFTSQWFGNTPRASGKGKKKVEHNPALEFLRDDASERWAQKAGGASLSKEWQQVVAATSVASREKRFFHWELEFPEVFYGAAEGTTQKIERGPDAGFDAVIGNPPWIRQETLQGDKSVLAAHFAEVFDSVADIYVFFLARGLQVLAPDRQLGMIVPNKWHRAAYGEKLRRALVDKAEPVTVIDFGHAPVFPDADTFPCILVVRNVRRDAEEDVRVCSVPREQLPTLDLPAFVAQSSRKVRISRLRPEGWDLEGGGISQLLDKIKRAGVPLREYIGGKPYRGVLTGFNEAFLIDQATRDRLVAEDPKCEPIIKKFLRGRDIQRWHPQWGGEWMIVLKSSENHSWPWANAGAKAEAVFRRTYPSVHARLEQYKAKLGKRQDSGRYWWELRSCDYYERFELPKLMYQEIAFHSRFCLDDRGYYANNKTFLLPIGDLYLLAVLNSPVLWRVMWSDLPHMKDEAIAMQGFAFEGLPIRSPSASQREKTERRSAEAVQLSANRQHLVDEFFDWLRHKIGATRLTQKLERYWQLDAATLVAEVKRAGVKALTPAAQRRLLDQHARQVAELRPILAKIRQLEIELQHLVFDLYGLTHEDVQLLRSTAPPRDPLALVEGKESA
jgi:hypothetical protein